MKRLFFLAVLWMSLSGCAVGVIAGAAAIDGASQVQMQQLNCLTRYGFYPAFEYGWQSVQDHGTGGSTMVPVLARAYVQRVAPDSYADRRNIAEGDLILNVNDKPVVDDTVMQVVTETNGERFSRMTLQSKAGQVYSVSFNIPK